MPWALRDAASILPVIGLSAQARLAGLAPSRRRSSACWRSAWRWRRGRACCCSTKWRPGLTEAEIEEMARLIRRLRDELDLTVVWIEHAVTTLLRHVERVIVLHQGRKIADGTPARSDAQCRGDRGLPGRRDGRRSGGARMMWHRSLASSSAARRAPTSRSTASSAGYGAILVLRGVKLEVKPGLTVILGPNGAGKTTLLRALSRPDPAQRRSAAGRRGPAGEDARDRPGRHGAGARRAAALSRR